MFAKIRFFGYNILGFSKVGEYSLTFIIKGAIMKIELGRVLRPQGIKGEIKVEPLSNPEFFKAIELVEINGKEALHVLKFPKQLLKASEWEIKVMRGKSDITPRFCSVRLVFE